MNTLQNNTSKKIAFGGVMTALSLICLYLTSILPTNRLVFYALSSMFLFPMLIEFGVSTAAITYLSTSVLAFIIIPNKVMLVPYLLFFGYYGILKFYIEKLNRLVLEWMFKIIAFNIILYIMYMIVTEIMMETVILPSYVWVTVVLGEIAFVVYDIGYSMAISYYKHKLRNRL